MILESFEIAVAHNRAAFGEVISEDWDIALVTDAVGNVQVVGRYTIVGTLPGPGKPGVHRWTYHVGDVDASGRVCVSMKSAGVCVVCGRLAMTESLMACSACGRMAHLGCGGQVCVRGAAAPAFVCRDHMPSRLRVLTVGLLRWLTSPFIEWGDGR